MGRATEMIWNLQTLRSRQLSTSCGLRGGQGTILGVLATAASRTMRG